MYVPATYSMNFKGSNGLEFTRAESVCGENCFFVIVDWPWMYSDTKMREMLSSLKTINGKKLVFLDADKMADILDNFLWRIIGKEKDVLFVFPGNGASSAKSLSGICTHLDCLRDVSQFSVFAKRFWTPGSEPVAMAGQIKPEIFMNLAVKTIVVVDDVISSGKTMQKLRQNNSWRFPRAKWIGVCWISQEFTDQTASCLKGYERIFAACEIWGRGKKVPLNSLSTLVECPEIARSYAERHFFNPEKFLAALKEIFCDEGGVH